MSLIAWDVDGPLADFTGGLCSALRVHGFNRTPADVHHWDLRRSFPATAANLLPKLIGERGFCRELPWVNGARERVLAIREAGHEQVCVTSPWSSDHWPAERLAWLASTFTADDVLFVKGPRKPLVRADILIEDHPGNAASWCDAHPKGRALLVDRPWNQTTAHEWRHHKRVIRVADDEILEWVRAIA